jgi:hypothetical protein
MDVINHYSPNDDKIFLCHVPDGNIGNPQTLSVNINAVPSHIEQHIGDRLGRCDQYCGYTPASGYIASDTEDTEHQPELAIYPNPSSKSFRLVLHSHTPDAVSLVVSDISGRILINKDDLEPNREMIFGEELTMGMFFARVLQGAFEKTVVVVKVP